jgi:hypothetical protein
MTADIQRRSLIAELHQPCEDPNKRVFNRPITSAVLEDLRPDVLAACWALVRNWDRKDRPKSSQTNTHCPEWAAVAVGIVEAAGLGCALTPPPESLDEDDRAMHVLARHMKTGERYAFQQMANMALNHGLFEVEASSTNANQASPNPKQRSTFGRILARYKNRPLDGRTFHIEGEFHGRRYWLTDARSEQKQTRKKT